MEAYVFIKVDKQAVKLHAHTISYIECRERFCMLYLRDEQLLATHRMWEMEALLPANRFCRIHRSYIVSIEQVQSFKRWQIILKDGKTLPLSRKYKDAFLRSVPVVAAKTY